MRLIRWAGACAIAVAAVAIIGTAGTGAGVGPLEITHPARLLGLGGRTTATWSSSNWSGFAEQGHFASVSASWTVPTVTAGASTASSTPSRYGFGRQRSTTAWYSATWTGIDGFNDSNLIQTGTEQDYYNGAAHYSAWWEILPAAETVIAKPVSPGDVIDASIVQTPTQVSVPAGRGRSTTESEWTITLTDNDPADPWTFVTTQPYAGQGSSAEWIVEAPDVNGAIAPLATYAFPSTSGAAGDFNSAAVSTTLGSPLVGAGLNYANDAGALVQNGVQVSTPGPPGPADPAATADTAFNTLYGATEPLAPNS